MASERGFKGYSTEMRELQNNSTKRIQGNKFSQGKALRFGSTVNYLKETTNCGIKKPR